MSAASHHQLTVSKNGCHYFSTSESHGHTYTDAEISDLYETFKKLFPESQGYRVSWTYWSCVGHVKRG